MADSDQAKPLAPALLFQCPSGSQQAKIIKCFGCFTALLLIIAATVLVLSFTVFHVKNPVIRLNSIAFLQLHLANGSFRNDTNVTITSNISVKNPNVGSFKFNNGSTAVFYGGINVGEATTPSGMAKARRTLYMNVTVNLIPDRILQVPGSSQDTSSGKLSMNSSTVIGGKVEILNIIRRNRVVEVNCSISFSLSIKPAGDSSGLHTRFQLTAAALNSTIFSCN